MHTKNKGKPKKNNKTQAYSTPRAEARAGPGRGLGPRPKLGVLQACILQFFRWVSCILGMHMPLLGWKLILGWN